MNNKMREEHNDLCVGIDLGTTNSVIAVVNEKLNGDLVSKVVEVNRAVDTYNNTLSGEAKLSRMKRPTLPSCVYYRQEKDYQPLVGDFSRIQYPLRPHLVAKSIKSQMGKPFAEGLSADIPDKTPAQISSRILQHMLQEAGTIFRTQITDAVITVPANFDPAMCKATRDAAELAGIKVTNADGSERPVLLSEPNAVIYDLINQIRNGEISSQILDLSEPKTVLVFDLGGGTLDITMHQIKRREDNPAVLKVDEIATNRYTLLGGDDFDEEIAKAMYGRYLSKYQNYPEAAAKIRSNEAVVMPQMRVYAENMKIELNERCSEDYMSGWDDSGWDDMEEDLIQIDVGGHMGGVGYAYDDTFTKEEIESILSVFMADELSYEDYKRIDEITNTRNLIYPVLDVLNKASGKLATDQVVVDAVIVNGGMSKFYMVTNRLKEFFGFEPIVALDPDQAVARGAAVYHYYLHQYEAMQDDMKLIGDAGANSEETSSEMEQHYPKSENLAIQWGNSILNDCLYLGVRNGAVHEIIPTGSELPYMSPVMTGFRLEPGQNMVSVPVKSRNLDGSYRTIASGNILFKREYREGVYVAFQIYMGTSKVITMKAWTSTDIDGRNQIEEGITDIKIDTGEKSGFDRKIFAPSGSILDANSEIFNLAQLCRNYEKSHKNKTSLLIKSSVKSICEAGNKEDFADPVLDELERSNSEEVKLRLFTIARKIGTVWNDRQKKRLASLCMFQIDTELTGFSIGSGAKISTNIQAVYTLSMCGSQDQLDRLVSLHNSSKYLQACLYTHGKTRSALPWLQEALSEDIKKAMSGKSNNLQFSSYAMGIALRKDADADRVLSVKEEGKIVKKVCKAILSGSLSSEQLTCCLLALGWICDQRNQPSDIDHSIIQTVFNTIDTLDMKYSFDIVERQEKARVVVYKMVNGDVLKEDEECFLLTKLEQ